MTRGLAQQADDELMATLQAMVGLDAASCVVERGDHVPGIDYDLRSLFPVDQEEASISLDARVWKEWRLVDPFENDEKQIAVHCTSSDESDTPVRSFGGRRVQAEDESTSVGLDSRSTTSDTTQGTASKRKRKRMNINTLPEDQYLTNVEENQSEKKKKGKDCPTFLNTGICTTTNCNLRHFITKALHMEYCHSYVEHGYCNNIRICEKKGRRHISQKQLFCLLQDTLVQHTAPKQPVDDVAYLAQMQNQLLLS